jgi:hypothetical protein
VIEFGPDLPNVSGMGNWRARDLTTGKILQIEYYNEETNKIELQVDEADYARNSLSCFDGFYMPRNQESEADNSPDQFVCQSKMGVGTWMITTYQPEGSVLRLMQVKSGENAIDADGFIDSVEDAEKILYERKP